MFMLNKLFESESESKRVRSSVMALLDAACDLHQDAISATQPQSGRPPKTSKHIDDVQRQELRRNLHLIASKLRELHPDLLGNVCRKTSTYQVDVLPPNLF